MKSLGRILIVTCVLLALMNLHIKAKPKKRGLATGLWGGQHISFDVSGKGVKIEFDCAHAAIDRPVVLDQHGRFNIAGKQFRERGGPVRQGEQAGYPVVFSGEVKGKTMTLAIQNSETK